MVDPEWHPGHDDNHEARNVNGENEKRQLPSKYQYHAKTTVSTCNKYKLYKFCVSRISEWKNNP